MIISLRSKYGDKFSGINFQHIANDAARLDPISSRYFKWVEEADHYSIHLFGVTALLSILVLLIDRETHSLLYDALQVLFAILVIVLFVLGITTRLYLTPRAEDKRRQDFFSSACGVSLIHETTIGYYNNGLTEPIPRIAAQLLENSFFSKNISRVMARHEWALVGVYIFVYLVVVLSRGTDPGFIVVA